MSSAKPDLCDPSKSHRCSSLLHHNATTRRATLSLLSDLSCLHGPAHSMVHHRCPSVGHSNRLCGFPPNKFHRFVLRPLQSYPKQRSPAQRQRVAGKLLVCVCARLKMMSMTNADTSLSFFFSPQKSIPVRGGEPITRQEYDLGQSKTVVSFSIGMCVFVAILHYVWGHLTPLILSSVLAIKNMHGTPLFKIHVMGHSSKLYTPLWAPPSMSLMFSDPEKYYELTQPPKGNGRRPRKKKLTGKEKRAQRSMDKAFKKGD